MSGPRLSGTASADERGLLDAIVATPDDDVPRLIYADWLDENGNAERADFIRIQIELARMPELADRETARRWRRLHDREWRLLEAHGRAWVGRVEARELLISPRTVTFRRGFPEEGYFTVEYLRDSIDDVLALPLLRDLCINGINGHTLPELVASPWLGELRGLTLQPGSASPDGAPPSDWGQLAGCPSLSRLRRFALVGNGTLSLEDAARVADNPALAGVRELLLSGPSLAQAMHVLLDGQAFRSLVHLDVAAYQHPRPIPRVLGNPRLAHLERLELGWHTADRATVEAITTAAFWPGLRKLSFSNCDLSPETIEVLASSRGRLESLSFIQNHSLHIMGLVGPVLHTVRELHLLQQPGVDAGLLGRLAEREWASNLRSLSLSNNSQVGDAEATLIARSPILGGLYHLDLYNTRVGSPGALALARSPYLNDLSLLNLWGCDLDERAVSVLRERFGDGVYCNE